MNTLFLLMRLATIFTILAALQNARVFMEDSHDLTFGYGIES